MSKELINVVLDLETLGTESDACIIQIGACVPEFDRHIWTSEQIVYGMKQKKLPWEFEATIRYEDCLQLVKTKLVSLSESTMTWWETQPTKTAVFSGQESYEEALHSFKEWIESFSVPVAIWGNGASFDNVILRHSLDAFGIHKLWSYKHDMCYRTLKNLYPGYNGYVLRGTDHTPHTGLGDARYQAEMLDLIARTENIRSLL